MLTREQASQGLQQGWTKESLICLHELSGSLPVESLSWGFVVDKKVAIYKTYTPLQIKHALEAQVTPLVQAYTDGSGTSAPRLAGIGVVVYRPNLRPELIAENIGPGSNNQAELTGIWRALRAVPVLEQPIVILTDSEYAIGSCIHNWCPKANQQLIANIREDLSHRPNVRIEHVPGHKNIEGNEIADRLATVGRKLITQVTLYEGSS